MATSNESIVDGEWKRIDVEMQILAIDEEVLKKRLDFPHATVRKIMNSEILAEKVLRRREDKTKEPVKFFISKETTVTLALACEFLSREIAIRAWSHTSANARKTLQKADVYAAVNDTDMFDFLIDKIPRMSIPSSSATTSAPETMVTTAAYYGPPPTTTEQDAKEDKNTAP